MWDFLRDFQIQILIGCCASCFMLAFFVEHIKFQSLQKKRALLEIELCVAFLLLMDALAYIYRGDTSQLGYWMTRISNFAVFALTLFMVYFFNGYITAIFMGTGRLKRLHTHLLLGFILPWVGITILIISQFTGMYYHFDQNNKYVRGPFFVIGAVVPLLVLLIQLFFSIRHREMINKRLRWSIGVFCIFPIVATILQYFLYGLSLINLSIWISAITIFWLALVDQNEMLTKAAYVELGSGLPNTYGFIYEVDNIIQHGDISLYNGYYFDIVRMVQYNNKYGRELGDEIIRRFGRAIEKEIDKDEIVGRLGGNFFVALVKKSNTDKFLELLRDVKIEIEVDERIEAVHVAAVAGIYPLSKKNRAGGQVIGNAAAAVNYAKSHNMPYAVFDERLEAKFNRIRSLEEGAKRALDNCQFEAFYQPKVDSRTNVMCGAEALVRWRVGSQVNQPTDFVPIMEKNASICKLDFYILEQVCRDLRVWMDQGLEPVRVSVNFSRKNLENPKLAQDIKRVIKRNGIPYELIQIEVTETSDEYPREYLREVVSSLKEYGITTAIDDFGTGSSSISLLKEVDFDVVKIDKVFVDYENDIEKKLLHHIIEMAKDLGISVLAEGLENDSKLEELRAMGCYEIQGFVYDKPLEKNDFEKRLANPQY